jgi:hypothetical protein
MEKTKERKVVDRTNTINENDRLQRTEETIKELRNEDPISGESGAHPVGTGIGAALGGAAAGAAAGLAAGPVGLVVGAVVGGVAGGLGGKAVAEEIDPTVEVEYWRNHYTNRPYYDSTYTYDEFAPAYRMAAEMYEPGVTYAEREAAIRTKWEAMQRRGGLTWERAREAIRDGWDRLSKTGEQSRNKTK